MQWLFEQFGAGAGAVEWLYLFLSIPFFVRSALLSKISFGRFVEGGNLLVWKVIALALLDVGADFVSSVKLLMFC